MAITDTAEGNEDDIMLIVGDSFGFIFLFDISGYCLMAAEEDPPECMYQAPLTVPLYSWKSFDMLLYSIVMNQRNNNFDTSSWIYYSW